MSSDLIARGMAKQVKSQLSHIVTNVKSFGAKGDGVTNDTEAIQNAINYLNTKNGGTLFFPVGTYLSDTLIIQSNIEIKGENKWLSVIKLIDSPTGALLECSGTSATFKTNININNIHLKHRENYSPTGYKGTLVNSEYARWGTICDCVLSNISNYGIRLVETDSSSDTTRSWTISRNIIFNETTVIGSGIFLGKASEYVDVVNNKVNGLYFGIKIKDSANVKIVANTCSRNTYGIHSDNSSSTINCGKFVIANNTCNHNGDTGIYIKLCGNKDKGVIITGNALFLNYMYGIFAKGIYGSIVSENKVVCGTGGTKGIELEALPDWWNGDYNLVSLNSITGGTIGNTMTGANNSIINNLVNIS
jgi:parallel beta-helix repeat protein